MINKLGFVLECDAGGPDELVFTCLVRRLSPGTQVKVVTMGSKKFMQASAAKAAQELIETDECDRVIIAWDYKPPFDGPPPARRCEDETAIMLKTLSVLPHNMKRKVRLLCLVHELETWLITEDRAVRNYLSTPEHKNKFKAPAKPLTKTDPKAVLSGEFKAVRGTRYEDFREAIRLVILWEDTRKVGKLDSFQRFAALVTGNAEADFQADGAACRDLAYQASRIGR